ncbi:gliding motility-associated ABC transporter substrate-binding protein GldG [soil metagenome]
MVEVPKIKSPGRSARMQSITRFLLMVLILISANIISAFVFSRFDLTGEKRYSLSTSTMNELKKMNDVMYVKIYLDGELPPSFKRLRNSTKELLDEFRVYAKDNIEYEFVDPSASSVKKERDELYKQLYKKGLQPTNLEERSKGSSSQKVIWPGAVVNFHGREAPINFLQTKIGSGTEENINRSVEGLEYEFMNVMRIFGTGLRPKVGFLQGQAELGTQQISDAARALSDYYEVDTVKIDGQLNALKPFKAIIVAKPDSVFSERDKFVLDQYVMNGGRILWLVETMQINMDSLSAAESSVAIAKDINILDQLFHYGVRINDDLAMDLQAAPIPLVTGMVGNQPQQSLFPWYFFPLLNPTSTHPIVHNLNAIKCEFTSTLDTVESPGITKTILLSTSKFSKRIQSPVRVNLNILKEDPDPSYFSQQYLPIAVLLEGRFPSVFRGRVPQEILNNKEIAFKDTGKENKMIVIADGDMISNYVSKKGNIYPLGYDRFTNQTYGNRNFILNCVDYLCDNENIVALRGKEFKIRLLDNSKTENKVYSWLAMLLPLILVLLYAIIHFYMRRKKYA